MLLLYHMHVVDINCRLNLIILRLAAEHPPSNIKMTNTVLSCLSGLLFDNFRPDPVTGHMYATSEDMCTVTQLHQELIERINTIYEHGSDGAGDGDGHAGKKNCSRSQVIPSLVNGSVSNDADDGGCRGDRVNRKDLEDVLTNKKTTKITYFLTRDVYFHSTNQSKRFII